jgi:hypothetical protein
VPIRRHIKFSGVRQRNTIKDWKGKTAGTPAFILGNGPSLNDIDPEILNPYLTIGINRAFYKLDPTILIWQDVELWYTERKRILKLSAIKVCRNLADPQNRFFHFKLANGAFKIPENAQLLHGRGATGPIAVQLAYIMGCDPIILLGCDCKHRGGLTDFYGRNRQHRPHTMRNCRQGLVWMKKTITDRRIISCSDNDVFERHDFNTVMKDISSEHRRQRSHWVSLLI